MGTASLEERAEAFIERALPRLTFLYGEDQSQLLIDELTDLIRAHAAGDDRPERVHWNERDVILISYGGSMQNGGEPPLRTLHRFLREQLRGIVTTVHILPFFPYSSDDGFAVIDYLSVDPDLGDWADIRCIAGDFDLMTDLVINHVSRRHLWFIDYINNTPPACYYFLEMSPGVDLSEVVRPRRSRVLVPVYTHRGIRHVWATFSEDQIDVNFANPNVLLEYVRILLCYLRNGARFVRLDAIAYLWKKLGTTCINLPQTHQVVKLLRDLLDAAAPQTVLLTETNLPLQQNLSYFGESDEAHMVYQFSLAPLLLHALHRGNSSYLSDWARARCQAPPGCTFLNFTASHDGIGLRPVEGLLPQHEIDELVDDLRSFGGFVSMKSNKDGTESPYELNITYLDALKGTDRGPDGWQIRRFLCSQAVMVALKGIPAVYIHSFTASPNDLQLVGLTGRVRSINRRIWDFDELCGLLADPTTAQAIVFEKMKRILRIRRAQSAFHPDAQQEVIDLGPSLFAFWRRSAVQQILVVSNLTDRPQQVPLQEIAGFAGTQHWTDLLGEAVHPADAEEVTLRPYRNLWLTDHPQLAD